MYIGHNVNECKRKELSNKGRELDKKQNREVADKAAVKKVIEAIDVNGDKEESFDQEEELGKDKMGKNFTKGEASNAHQQNQHTDTILQV